MILDYLGGPSDHKVSYTLKRNAEKGEPERCSMRRTWPTGLEEDLSSKGSRAKECKQPQEAGKGRNSMDSTLEPPEEMRP